MEKENKRIVKRFFRSAFFGFLIGLNIPKIKEQLYIKEQPEQEIIDIIEIPKYEPYKKEIPEHLRKEYQELIDVPKEYIDEIMRELNETEQYIIMNNNQISEKSLNDLRRITIFPESKSLDFLKYCTNLEEINILNYDKQIINMMPKMPNIKKIFINVNEFNSEVKKILDTKMPNIENLNLICTLEFEPGLLEKMSNLKKLTICPKQNCDIDFKKLSQLEELEIASTEPYNIAIWLNLDEYKTLKKNNVKITFEEGIENKYLEISGKLEKIITKLNINKDNTDKEKYNKILIYILDNLQYDDDVKKLSENRNDDFYKLISTFYEDGMLYAALEKKSQICGNYSALFEALCDRIYTPEQSYMLKSETHAWNIIKLDGISYYVDATWLDDQHIIVNDKCIKVTEAIEQGLSRYLYWYLEKPESEFVRIENELDDCHIPKHIPEHFAEQQKVKIKN